MPKLKIFLGKIMEQLSVLIVFLVAAALIISIALYSLRVGGDITQAIAEKLNHFRSLLQGG